MKRKIVWGILTICFVLIFFNGTNSYADSLIPKISSASVTENGFNTDIPPALTITPQASGLVQYRIFFYNKETGVLIDATHGYTAAVDGTKSYTAKLDTTFIAGNYRISVWVKRANTDGINSNQNGSFDSSLCIENIVCEQYPQIFSAGIQQSKLTSIDQPVINVNLKSSKQFQYRVFFYNIDTKTLIDATQGYVQAVSNSISTINVPRTFNAGKYRISIWLKRTGASGLKSNENGDYDSSYCIENASVYSDLKIVQASTSETPLVSGDKVSFNVTTYSSQKVQYRVFFYNLDTKILKDVTNGYLPGVDTKTQNTIQIDNTIPAGNYRVSIWARIDGQIGQKSNENGDYDSSLCLENVQCINPPAVSSATVNPSTLTIKSMPQITMTSTVNQLVQYRVFFYAKSSMKLIDVTNGYLDAVNGQTPFTFQLNQNLPADDYRVSIWVKRSGIQGCKSNVNGDYDGSYCIENLKIYSIQTINSVSLESGTLTAGEKPTFDMSFKGNGKLSLRVFFYNKDTGELTDVTNGYIDNIDPSVPYKLAINKAFIAGNYRVSVWIKETGTTGIFGNSNGDFDDKYIIENQVCIPAPTIQSASLTTPYMIYGQAPAINIVPKYQGMVQYRVFIYNKDTNKLTDLTNGYTSPMDGNTPYLYKISDTIDVSKYRFSVWIKRANKMGFLSNSNGDYDSSLCIETYCAPVIQLSGNPAVIQLGDQLSFGIKALNIDQVQYDVLCLEEYTGILKDISGGYTNATNGDVTYNYKMSNTLGTGKFKITVRVRRNGVTGLFSDNYGNYDNSYSYETMIIRNSSYESYKNTQYSISLSDAERIQYNSRSTPVYDSGGEVWKPASMELIDKYMNPMNFVGDEYGKYQFLVLSFNNEVSASDVNNLLSNKGILIGTGQEFYNAAKNSNVNLMYLVSHALLETGNGTSRLATGVVYNGRTVYNMFGIGAYDSDPIGGGSKYAYDHGWFSVDAAISGGANFISSNYINNGPYYQNTLYKMRWNPAKPDSNQYATDVLWAYNQVFNIKRLYDKCPNAKLYFDIPVYY